MSTILKVSRGIGITPLLNIRSTLYPSLNRAYSTDSSRHLSSILYFNTPSSKGHNSDSFVKNILESGPFNTTRPTVYSIIYSIDPLAEHGYICKNKTIRLALRKKRRRQGSMEKTSGKKKWRMILYEDQDYPYNYIDESFLDGIREKGFKKIRLRHVFKKMLIVTDHISAIIILNKLYFSIKDNLIPLRYIYLGILVSLIMFLVIMMLSNAPREEYLRNLRMIFIIYFTLELFQGVLQTLISSFSDDTVYALALFIAIFHVLTQTYNLGSVKQEFMKEDDVIPMNCMILTSIVLASRLEDSLMASGFIQLSILLLSLLPRIKLYIEDTGISALIYGFTGITTLITCLTLKPVFICLYLFGILATSVLLPLLYIHFQKFKRDITGPWDPDSIKKSKRLKNTVW